MTGDRDDLAERLAFVVGSVNRRLRPPAEALSHVAVSALASIERLGDVRPGDLARVEGVGAPGMTRLVAELEGRGLLVRSPDPDDGRAHRVRLTADGTAAVAEARRVRASGVAALLDDADAADLAALDLAVGVLERALLTHPVAPVRQD
ncbi:MarR family winged helix-turn-helix transcriptional regulator [Amnibacterium endophyticum]|uniref:MarR family winged helix-turn-helix transcriptional regulator n=1 Tax=Amnibacterium endophyticum TaxID=2109337 RepID=A0ABW4LDX3_9MICO